MTEFRVPDPQFERRVRDSFARQGIMSHIGADLTVVEPGRCEIRLAYGEHVSQQHGFFHGGVVSTIADSAGGYAAFTLMPADVGVLTVEYKVNLTAPADGELLIACGEVVRPGRTLTVSRAEVFAVKDGSRRSVALMQQTLMCITGRPDVIG